MPLAAILSSAATVSTGCRTSKYCDSALIPANVVQGPRHLVLTTNTGRALRGVEQGTRTPASRSRHTSCIASVARSSLLRCRSYGRRSFLTPAIFFMEPAADRAAQGTSSVVQNPARKPSELIGFNPHRVGGPVGAPLAQNAKN